MIVKESDAGAWLLFTLCALLKLEYETVIIRARSGVGRKMRVLGTRGRTQWLGLLMVLFSHANCQGQAGAGADFTNLPVPVGEQDVAKTAQDFAERLGNWSCHVLRTGGPLCQVPGMSNVYDSLLTGTLSLSPRAFLGSLCIALAMVTLNHAHATHLV